MNKKIILGYINEDSIVTEEQAKILTHMIPRNPLPGAALRKN